MKSAFPELQILCKSAKVDVHLRAPVYTVMAALKLALSGDSEGDAR